MSEETPYQGCGPSPGQSKNWLPPALRWWNLSLGIAVCWSLIASLQYLLHQSQTTGGVIWAWPYYESVNDLPLDRSFAYLYMPTVLAVLFGIYIVWIDHDARRFEPYRQMATGQGSLGRDSVLLHYPFDFILTVPIAALKRRHWMVFFASTATVLTTLGIVPLQAGIFETRTVSKQSSQQFQISQKYTSPLLQTSASTLLHAQSVHGIVTMNATLPPFMTAEFTLLPFIAKSKTKYDELINQFVANTTLYSVDVSCKVPLPNKQTSTHTPSYNVSHDCTVDLPQFGNRTIGEQVYIPGQLATTVKHSTYDSFYASLIPKSTNGGNLGVSTCTSDNGEFLAAFVRNKLSSTDAPNSITTVLCKPFYYQQNAQATILGKGYEPIASRFGTKKAIPPNVFNPEPFELTLGSGLRKAMDRVEGLPGLEMPRYLEELLNKSVTPVMLGGEFAPISAMALAMTKEPIESLLNPQALEDAYEAAYRLIFVRAMTAYLKANFSDPMFPSVIIDNYGWGIERREAVALEPVFTYLVEALLALVSLLMGALLYMTVFKKQRAGLADDPGSISAIMSMLGDSPGTLKLFEVLDCCTSEYFTNSLQNCTFTLGGSHLNYQIMGEEAHRSSNLQSSIASNSDTIETQHLATPMRPFEFRSYPMLLFIGLFVTLLTTISALYSVHQASGLPIPSKNSLVLAIVTEYIPVLISTLIEPMWILLNRLLCTIQPLEELRTNRARADRSILLNYASFPPQFALFKAFRARHILLGTVCVMTLFSNLLATTAAGLFFKADTEFVRKVRFLPPFESLFLPIDPSSGPPLNGRPSLASTNYSGAYQGGVGEDQFLIAEANLTGTPLPPWIGSNAMYLPFAKLKDLSHGDKSRASTHYFRGVPNCRVATPGLHYSLRVLRSGNTRRIEEASLSTKLNVTVSSGDGIRVNCSAPSEVTGSNTTSEPVSKEILLPDAQNLDHSETVAAEISTTLVATFDATPEEKRLCRSTVAVAWLRREGGIESSDSYLSDNTGEWHVANNNDTLLILCQPRLLRGYDDVLVDRQGNVLLDVARPVPDSSLQEYTANGVDDLMSQSNLFIFRSLLSGWHSDSYAGEYIHHFIRGNFTDPRASLPTYEAIELSIRDAYARVFAAWLGRNRERLFVPVTSPAELINGVCITREERIFIRPALFIVTLVILGTYVLVSIMLYWRRPGRYLARTPTSIASIIALFASSAAMKDFKGTLHMTNHERKIYLRQLDFQYGYGSYVGSDGAVHVGIEKVPYVTYIEGFTFAGSRTERELQNRC